MIEEQLGVTVERMQLEMCDRNELGEIRVAAVESEIIARWLELLDDTGLSPGIMVPDVLCVPGGRIPGGRIPGGSDEVNILLDGQRALCRIGLSEGFAVDRDQLSIFLGLLDDAEGAASGDESDKSENARGFRVYSDQTDAQHVL